VVPLLIVVIPIYVVNFGTRQGSFAAESELFSSGAIAMFLLASNLLTIAVRTFVIGTVGLTPGAWALRFLRWVLKKKLLIRNGTTGLPPF
jgi:hypothetical protein